MDNSMLGDWDRQIEWLTKRVKDLEAELAQTKKELEEAKVSNALYETSSTVSAETENFEWDFDFGQGNF